MVDVEDFEQFNYPSNIEMIDQDIEDIEQSIIQNRHNIYQ